VLRQIDPERETIALLFSQMHPRFDRKRLQNCPARRVRRRVAIALSSQITQPGQHIEPRATAIERNVESLRDFRGRLRSLRQLPEKSCLQSDIQGHRIDIGAHLHSDVLCGDGYHGFLPDLKGRKSPSCLSRI